MVKKLYASLVIALFCAVAMARGETVRSVEYRSEPSHESTSEESASKTLAALLKSNGRSARSDAFKRNRAALVRGQKPSAIILGCADSRTAPELVFQRGYGELFVVRNAGNVADDVTLASIEYAAEHLGSSLLIVMGHQKCGAVTAAVSASRGELHDDGSHIGAIISRIAPAVRNVTMGSMTSEEFVDACVAENARVVARDVLARSKVLRHLVEEGKLKVVAAKYSISTGKVEKLEEL